MKKRLYRTETDKKLCGVCGGLAEYLELDPTLMRLLWVIVACFSAGAVFIAYIVAAIIVPNKSEVEKEMREESEKAGLNTTGEKKDENQ